MKNNLLCLLLILNFIASNFVVAQPENLDPTKKESSEEEPDQLPTFGKPLRIGLHLVPSTILNFNNRIRAGFQLNATKWSGGVDFSYGASWLPNPWLEEGETGLEDYSFYGLRPEIRYHFATSSNKLNHNQLYVALEGAFTYFERTLRNDRFEFGDQDFSYDVATLQRVRHSIVLKLGLNLIMNEAIYIDMYAGLGAAFRQFAYRDIVNLREVERLDDFEDLFPTPFRTWETRWVPDMAFGFRLGIYL